MSAPGAVDFGLIPSRVKTMTLKLVFIASLLAAQHKGTVSRTSRQVSVVPLGKALSGIPHVGVVDRWPAISKRARYSALIAFP